MEKTISEVTFLEAHTNKQKLEQQNVSIKQLENELGVYFTRMKSSTQDMKEDYNMVDDEPI
ncbi:hypothetical protein [Cytobacillus luteolus]|uniref:hypothetical protein n=1 Tax=Litchfieldia luteola TaxID=682179 RepID=UPI0018746A89|nr:hypothetical protein [Cytobacillus luteolus]MBP1942451.1 hypothetical protein [Cytobacillus luteolus]